MTEELFGTIWEEALIRNVFATLILLIGLIVFRIFALRTLRGWKFPSHDIRRRWVVLVQNVGVLVFILGVIVIWASELRTFALSVAAIAVALVLATKEILLCVMGGVLRTSAKPYGIGDRIEIHGIRGDVIDENLLVTTILEVGPGPGGHDYSGRQVTFPNSLLFTAPVFNESHTDHYALHSFRYSARHIEDWRKVKGLLLSISEEETKVYAAKAQDHFNRVAKRRALEPFSVRARVNIDFPEPDRIDFVIRVPIPESRGAEIQERILERFLEAYHGEKPQ